MKNIVILISGRGSNMQAIVNAKIPHAHIAAVISNHSHAKGLAWAREQGIATQYLNHQDFENRLSFDLAMLQLIDSYQPDLVVLAGFMRILSAEFCQHYHGKLMNIHPSLLPAFPGLHTHEQAISSGCKIAGCTVHFVTPKLDHGPIIAQAAVPVFQDDTTESLAQRILECEHQIYPQAIKDFIAGNLSIKDNKVINQHFQNSYSTSLISLG